MRHLVQTQLKQVIYAFFELMFYTNNLKKTLHIVANAFCIQFLVTRSCSSLVTSFADAEPGTLLQGAVCNLLQIFWKLYSSYMS